MKVIRVKDYEGLSFQAAKIVSELLKAKPKSNLGLATGSSPIGLYQNLIKMYKGEEISFKDVKTFNLDEYCGLPKEHKESYYTYMHRNLFDHIDIKEKNIHLPSAEGKNPEKNCKAYNKLLNKAKIDLQILGIGSNGHIGFNEPGTPFEQETSIVRLTDKTREDNKRFFDSIDEVPTHSITMGIKNIMQAKKILMLISGVSKQKAVKELLSGNISEDFPASVLNNHPDVTVIIDDAAFGEI